MMHNNRPITISISSEFRLKVASNLASLFETEELIDVIIQLKDAQIGGHKVVLASACDYFRTSFRFNQKNESEKSVIDLSHLLCGDGVIQQIIQSFYTFQLTIEEHKLSDMLRAVDYLMCEELRQCIETFMVSTLNFSNAILYYQLALQYSFSSTKLFENAQCLLWYRFHDFFIYEPLVIESSPDYIKAYIQYDLFHHCNPLQIIEFAFVNCSKNAQTCQSSETCSTHIKCVFEVISNLLNTFDENCLQSWSTNVLGSCNKFLQKEKDIHSELLNQVNILSSRFQTMLNSKSHIETRSEEEQINLISDKIPVSDEKEENQNNSCTNDSKINLSERSTERSSNEDYKHNTIVALAPSPEMASQLFAVDAGTSRPLVKAPQLSLTFYDVQMKTWKQGCTFDFPIQGAMLDKHAWRIAYLDNCLYMFSVYKAIGLEFNILEGKWTHFPCKSLFQAHEFNSPVKSVVPISVGKKLVVLSMSREAKADGTFGIIQKFYVLKSDSRTFECVAQADGRTMSLPITQWTVHENYLITVKASTLMHAQVSRIENIHVFDVENYNVKTYNASSAMVSRVKLLIRDRILFLFDKEGWCKSFDLDKGEFTNLSRYSDLQLSVQDGPMHGQQVNYPALTRVTCHASTSRWEITTSSDSFNARALEVCVDASNSLQTVHHPPPPFQFLTALCPGKIQTDQLLGMPIAKFEYIESKNA